MTATTQTHSFSVGSPVKVRFQAGHFNGRYIGNGWRAAIVTNHSVVGESRVAGGYPTYDVTLRDGHVVTHCAPECVRAK